MIFTHACINCNEIEPYSANKYKIQTRLIVRASDILAVFYSKIIIFMNYIQLNLVDSKSSGPRKILRNTEASDKRITNIHVYLPKNFSCKKYVETEFF